MNVARTLKQAIRQAQRGRPGDARAMCGTVLRAAPQHAEAHHLMGLFCKDSGDLAAAEGYLRRALEIRGDQPDYLCSLGAVLALAGQLEEAVSSYQRSLDAAPDNLAARADLARTWQQLGRLDRAAGSWRAVIARAPGELAAHFGLGNVCFALGDYREAAACFQRVLAARSGHVDSLNNLASCRVALGELPEAERILRQGIALAPKAARLHANLGAALAAQGRIEAPIECYERALALQPDYLSAAVKLANHLVEIGHYKAAELRFKQVLLGDPGSVEAVAGLASALERCGERDEASALVEAHIHLAPQSTNLVATAATLWRRTDTERAAALVEERLRRPMPEAQRALLLQHRGHLLDASGDHRGAFQAWGEANAARRLSMDRDAWWAEIDATRASFDAETLASLPRASDRSELPVLIVGMPRSGTSLVEQIVASHPAVHGAGELELLRVMSETARSMTGRPWPQLVGALTPAQLDRLGGSYLEKLRARDPRASRVIDKMPQNFRWLGLAGLALPGARVIHCRRAPAEIALSCYRQSFSANLAWDNSLEDIAHFYRGCELLMAHWMKVRPLSILEVDYEQLVTDPEAVIPELIGFCGLEMDPRCLRPHENRRSVKTASYAQVRRPIYTSAVNRSAPYAEQLAPFRAALASLRETRT